LTNPNLEQLKLQSVFVDNVTIMNPRAEAIFFRDARSRRKRKAFKKECAATIEYLVDSGFADVFGGYIDASGLDYPDGAFDYAIDGKGNEDPFDSFPDMDPVLAESLYLMRIGFKNVTIENGEGHVKLNIFSEPIFIDGAIYLMMQSMVSARLKADTLRKTGENAVSLHPLLPLFSSSDKISNR
jgi:hypothetical protein